MHSPLQVKEEKGVSMSDGGNPPSNAVPSDNSELKSEQRQDATTEQPKNAEPDANKDTDKVTDWRSSRKPE